MSHFDTASNGASVEKITIGDVDLTVNILTWGAIVQSVRLADVDHDLTLGSDNLADYEGEMRHHGSLIGPVVNRISGGRVKLGGMMHELERNQDGEHTLHSGRNATHRRNWELVTSDDQSVTLRIEMPDGYCELPGHRVVTVTYRVEAPATLSMTVKGETDDATLMNFANHSYWNLDGSDSWDGHTLRLAADHYLPTTPAFTPTGDIVAVDGTVYDLRAGAAIHPGSPDLDTNFCLSNENEPIRDVLWLTGKSGVSMTLATTAPGVQVFDAWNAQRPGRPAYEGLAIEAQHWPDAPNNRAFPSIVLRPGETYRQETSWTFNKA